MPPAVALLSCVLLVIGLLRLTARTGQGNSRSLCIPTLWLMIGASRPVSMWLYPEASSTAESLITGSLPDQIVLGLMLMAAAAVILNRRLVLSRILSENRWLLVLFAYMAVSILWSEYPAVSLKRWIKAFGAVLCGIVLATESDPMEALEIVLRRVAYVLLPLSVVLFKYFPAYGVDYGRWGGARMARGVCMQKNGLGLLSAICAFFLIWGLLRRRRLRLISRERTETAADALVLFFAIYLLAGAGTGAYSATAIGVLGVGLAGLVAVSAIRRHPESARSLAVVCVGVLAAVVGLMSLLGSSPMGWWAKLLGRDQTLTGRLDIWAEVFKIAPKWSLVGTGYGGFWGLPYTFIPIGNMTGHSGYLDVYVELGAVGVTLLAVFLLKLWRRLAILAKEDFDWAVLGICLLIMSLGYNYTESDYVSVSTPLWLTLVFVSLATSRKGAVLPHATGGEPRA